MLQTGRELPTACCASMPSEKVVGARRSVQPSAHSRVPVSRISIHYWVTYGILERRQDHHFWSENGTDLCGRSGCLNVSEMKLEI